MSSTFDFSIAVSPNRKINLDIEMKFIKSALLYADKITLISPIAYLYFQLTDKKYKKNERQALKLIDKVAPFIRSANSDFYQQSEPVINEFKEILLGKHYKSIPYINRLQVKKGLDNFVEGVNNVLEKNIGKQVCDDLLQLVKKEKIKVEEFDNSFNDINGYISEYFSKLKESVSYSYPLFDKESSKLMSAAINSGIIDMSKTKKYKTIHAGVADNLVTKLPSFEFATVDEILDIRKDLENPLIRFRSKSLKFSENIQNLPWNEDFEDECYILYDKEIAPALLEIEESIQDNNFIKNLGRSILTDKKVWNSLGGLVFNIAAAGAIASLSDTVTFDTAKYVAGGAWVLNKIASNYNSYRKNSREIQRKDLFFYYKAGKMMNKE